MRLALQEAQRAADMGEATLQQVLIALNLATPGQDPCYRRS